MDNVHLNTYKPHLIIEQLAKNFNLDVTTDCLEKKIQLSKKQGEGFITGFTFSDGIGLILFSVKLKNSLLLSFSDSDFPPLFLSCVVEGSVHHKLNKNSITYRLTDLQQSISANKKNTNESIYLQNNSLITFAKIVIDRNKYLEKIDCYSGQLPKQLRLVLEDIDDGNCFLFESQCNLGAVECVHSIIKNVSSDIIRSNFIEGQSLILLSRLITKFYIEKNILELKEEYTIDKNDEESIIKASEIIDENLRTPPVIIDLAKAVGVNQNKLKIGFKHIYGEPIREYIINKRLEMAKVLLLSNKYSIKEIAYKIGYTNTSYFTRIFKKKFGVLPSEYNKYLTQTYSLLKSSNN